MTIWRVGMKATQIRGVRWEIFPGVAPVSGVVYTVRATQFSGDNISLVFDEIRNGHASNGREFAFLASAFRPVVETKTDISIFIRMLNPSHFRVSEDA